MSHFARIDENNIVQEVLVVEQEFINTGQLGDPSRWIQTSYNTRGGVHVNGGTPLRKNYAGRGMIYDPHRDAFYTPKPMASGTWILDENSCEWIRPVPKPTELAAWCWNESTQSWFITDDPLKMGGWIAE
jgi:hypothetical protein